LVCSLPRRAFSVGPSRTVSWRRSDKPFSPASNSLMQSPWSGFDAQGMAAPAAVSSSSPLTLLRERLEKFKRLLGEPVSATQTKVQVPHFPASSHSSEARGRRRRPQPAQQPRRHAASPAVPQQEKDTDWGDLEWLGARRVERSGFESDDSLDVALRRLRATTTQVCAFQDLDVRVRRCPQGASQIQVQCS
jgi:hypothetical protein